MLVDKIQEKHRIQHVTSEDIPVKKCKLGYLKKAINFLLMHFGLQSRGFSLIL